MKRNPREKAQRKKELAEREAKQGRVRREKEGERERRKREHKERGKSVSVSKSGDGSNWRRSYCESEEGSESDGESRERGKEEKRD